MRINKIISRLSVYHVVIAVSLVFHGTLAKAEWIESSKGRAALTKGMTLSEVQALWGEPAEKIENEIKQQSIWVYSAKKHAPSSTLAFKKGFLDSVSNLQMLNNDSNSIISSDPGYAASSQFVATKNSKTRVHSFMALSDQKILNEILKEVPSEAESAEVAGAKTSSPAAPVPSTND